MSVTLGTKKTIFFDSDISSAEEIRLLGKVLDAIADYKEEVGRDGRIVVAICCSGLNGNRNFELGSGMEEHDDAFASIEALKRIYESVQPVKKRGERVEVIISAET